MKLARMAAAAALPAKRTAASAVLAMRGGRTPAGRTFVPVIIGRSRFCPLTAA